MNAPREHWNLANGKNTTTGLGSSFTGMREHIMPGDLGGIDAPDYLPAGGHTAREWGATVYRDFTAPAVRCVVDYVARVQQ